MRVVALHPDVLLATSAIWQTNCVIVRGAAGEAHGDEPALGPRGETGGPPEETFAIDSPVLPEELEALPAVLTQAGFPSPRGVLATHGDWDHLLGRIAFPEAPLGCAQSTAERLREHPGEAQRELRDFDRGFYVERPRPLALGQAQALPVPGRCGIGARELELHPAAGHTADGMALAVPWAGVLVVGDYLSTVESPTFEHGGSPGEYRATLERLRPLVGAAERIVPGHGPVLDRERALRVLDEHLEAVGSQA